MIEITCMLCGAHVGWMETQHNFVDTRCTPCEITHGSFKALAEQYIAATHHDWPTAELFVKKNPKREAFTPALAAVVADIQSKAAEKKQVI